MSKTDYPGIDYGLGKTNIDEKTGIRFGIIPVNELYHDVWSEIESIYVPFCPECNTELKEDDYLAVDDGQPCPHCGKTIADSEDCLGDEPTYNKLITDDYTSIVDDTGDLFLIKSKYYTFAQFCSPCAPGAGYILNHCEDGPKTYCFGHEMFEDEKAPYPVYSVETNELIKPKE